MSIDKVYWRGKTTAQKDGNDYMNPDGEPEGDWCYTTDKIKDGYTKNKKIQGINYNYGGEPVRLGWVLKIVLILLNGELVQVLD